jgi:hypothetical protein
MLPVVEDQEEVLGGQERFDPFRRWSIPHLPQAEGLRNGRGDQAGIADRSEGDKGNTVAEVGDDPRCGLDCQAGFSDAAGTDERQQAHPVAAEQRDDFRNLPLPADERGERQRQGKGRTGPSPGQGGERHGLSCGAVGGWNDRHSRTRSLTRDHPAPALGRPAPRKT